MKTIAPVILLCGLFAARTAAAPCPYSSSAWNELRGSEKDKLLADPAVGNLSDTCFIRLLQKVRETEDQQHRTKAIISLIRRFVETKGHFSVSLLSAGMRQAEPSRTTPQWHSVLDLWKTHNGGLRQSVRVLEDAGRLHEADTVYTAFGIAGAINTHDLISWARLKAVLGDHRAASRLMCTVSEKERRLTAVARSQFLHMLRETQPDTIAMALQTYRECMLKHKDVDTVKLRGWITRSLSRFGLYHEEIATLIKMETRGGPVGQTLFSLAQRHFSRRRYELALAAARPAYERSTRANTRSVCATIIYQSYVQTGLADSALTWLKRADLTSPQARMQAAALYQQAGKLTKADSIVSLLAPGINRDTLAIRQLLFRGKPDSAAEAALRLGSQGGSEQLERTAGLWRARSLLFAADMASFKQTLDSLQFDPSWPYAAEMLRHRYSFERVKSDPAAMSAWSQLEYALYRDEPTRAIPSLRAQKYAPPAAAMLVLRLARALLLDNRPAEAQTVLDALDATQAPPEHMYYCAEALYRQGEPQQARDLLQELIMAHPQDIFSSKARILLQKTQS